MTKFLIRWLLYTVLVSLAGNLYGQQYHSFQNLSKKEGLSQASVFAITQDKSGFLWFGTRNGLNKFDGYQFKVYKKDTTATSLVADDIRYLYGDPLNHDVWVGTLQGLSRYQHKTDDFINYINTSKDTTSISSNTIRQVLRDAKGRLWVGTEIGLNLYQKETNDFTRFYIGDQKRGGPISKDVKTIFEDSENQIWVGTNEGLYRLEDGGDTYRFARVENLSLSDTHIKSIVEDHKNNLWIGTELGGVNYWDRSKNKITIYKNNENSKNKISHNTIRSMVIDNNDNLWVGTFDGLNLLEKEQTEFKIFKKEEFQNTGLSDYSIRSLFVDRSGSLWIGTYHGGVNHWVENYNQFKNFKHIPNQNSLSGNVVSSFTEDKNGNLWIGTEGGGLNYFNKKKNQFQYYKYQPGKQNTLSGNNIKQLLLDDDQLWIGTFKGGLSRLDIPSGKFTYFKNDPFVENSLSNNSVYGGLNKVSRDEKGFPSKFKTYFPNETIYALQESNDQKIWVGTYTNGLYLFDPVNENIKHFTTADGLSGNTIFGILEFNEDEVWLSTNNGITRFNLKKTSFTNYDYSNGLTNLEHNFNAYYKTRSNNFLFGGIDGFTEFNPQNFGLL